MANGIPAPVPTITRFLFATDLSCAEAGFVEHGEDVAAVDAGFVDIAAITDF